MDYLKNIKSLNALSMKILKESSVNLDSLQGEVNKVVQALPEKERVFLQSRIGNIKGMIAKRDLTGLMNISKEMEDIKNKYQDGERS
jgi:hypothetical protein